MHLFVASIKIDSWTQSVVFFVLRLCNLADILVPHFTGRTVDPVFHHLFDLVRIEVDNVDAVINEKLFPAQKVFVFGENDGRDFVQDTSCGAPFCSFNENISLSPTFA